MYNAVWLRVRLYDFVADKKYKFLSKQNGRFSAEIKKAVITPLHEALYARYKEGISFEGAPSLHSLLNGNSDSNVYNTYMIDVYDGNLLIGTGCFDLGNESAAGIYSVYDPAYKKFSLGKYMIYEKMMFCKNKNFTYFYPGYVVPGYPAFDYKLRIGKPAVEFFDAKRKQWYPVFLNDKSL